MRFILFLVASLVACSTTESDTAVHAVSAALTYTVTSSADSDAIDGVCTFREAWRAASTNTAVDTCGAGGSADIIELPESWDMSRTGQDNTALNGDLDFAGSTSIELQCLHTACVLDAHGIDRLFHIVGSATFIVSGPVTLKNGCSNGGSCNGSASGSIPTGGALYFNSTGELALDATRFEDNTAANGGAFGLCAGSTPTTNIEGIIAIGNTATSTAGAVEAHVPWACSNCRFEDNTAAWGGAISQYAAEAILYNSDVVDNIATGSGGGLFARGVTPAGGTSSGSITMVGGSLTGNTAAGSGGGAYAGQRWTEVCGSGSCRITLDDVEAHTNTSTTGGGTTQATGGLVELRGTADLSSNTDTASPYAHDCSGTIHLYDASNLGDATGCTVDDQRGPVCGNDEVETGEDCDGTACCAIDCTFSSSMTSCDDSNACTVTDTCNGFGTCQGSGSTCGDGTLQTACGEACDDANTASLDGCSSSCMLETCVAWE